MKKLLSLLIFLYTVITISAQTAKRSLTIDDIQKWNRITETQISNNGEFIVYKLQPGKGNAVLKITTSNADENASVTGGTNAKITANSKFVVFTLKPPADTIRTLKLKKTKKEDLPQDKLIIYNLESNKTDTIEKLKSVKIPAKWADWIAYQTEAPKDTTKKEKGKKDGDDKVYPLFIKNLSNEKIIEIPAVSSYFFSERNKVITYISVGKDSTFNPGVYVYDLEKDNTSQILSAKGNFKKLTINKTGDKIAFLADTTSVKEKTNKYSLYLWNGKDSAVIIADNQNQALTDNWEISENGSLTFSENNNRLFLGTAPIKAEKDTTKLEEEIPNVDVWTWNEETLHTVQINHLKNDLKKSYLAVVHLDNNKMVQLETKQFTGIRKIKKGDSDRFVAWSNRPYAVQSMWEGSPRHNDFYLIDINTGEPEMIKKDCRATPGVSANGKYLYWYNAIDTTLNTYNIETGTEYKITTPKTVQIANELNDIPNPPGSYGLAGWLQNDAALLIYDRFDIWRIDPENRTEPVNITQNGRQQNIVYRLIKFSKTSKQELENVEGINTLETAYLKGHNEITRADSYYRFDIESKNTPTEIFSGNFKLNTPRKAKDTEVVLFTKENFETYPNLLATDLSFKNQQQISDAAPQQNEFLWGTAELVSWTSLDGQKLEGTLHKPANFDPNKKYPMIVNFYEKSSQGLLSYHLPQIGRSTIDYHYYTSRGYIIFNPDVYYKEGYPGESAFNCVMPGVTAMIAKGFIDEKHIGAQGHSWGGYQVAYLATRTNMFAAIESGAPVVNMFSAYGGIRWGSGMNRSFQYEHTQSRIGKSIWESPLRYLENSPLFTLDKINTPILIMHNDDDGAVPWYQGIEFFIGLRRLQKPAWLLNYNEADHWPTKFRDKKDFQIRMAQFFDHYLKDEPMPKWMKSGIPAVKKGIEMGYEFEE